MSLPCSSFPKEVSNRTRGFYCLFHGFACQPKLQKASLDNNFVYGARRSCAFLFELPSQINWGTIWVRILDYGIEVSFEQRNFHHSGIAFALFDSQLDQLRLPILRPPAFHHTLDHDMEQPAPRMDSVAIFVEKYFEWLAVFHQGKPSALPLGSPFLSPTL